MRITKEIIEADKYPDNEFKTLLLEAFDKMTITQGELDNWFTYHPPTEEQNNKYLNIRNAARYFAEVIVANTPPSADQTAAIRKIREAVMTANSAIACGQK